jgi:hypothetical protein
VLYAGAPVTVLEAKPGRIERYETLAETKDAALKI